MWSRRRRRWAGLMQRFAVLLAVFVLLGVVLLAHRRGRGNDETTVASTWDHQRRMIGHFWGDLRWQRIPGLRLTPEKEHLLWNRALEYALKDDRLGRPSGEVVLTSSPDPDSDYAPAVDDLVVTRQGWDQVRCLAELHGAVETVGLSKGDPETPVSVKVWVSRGIVDSQGHGCTRAIGLSCRNAWGDWTCRRSSGPEPTAWGACS